MKKFSLIVTLLAELSFMGLTVNAQQIISQNNSMSIGIGIGITCNESGLNNGGGKIKETHFYRYFDLPNDYNIHNGFTVSTVNFGILWFVSGGAGYPITINIYSADIGEFPTVNKTLQGSATYISSGNEMFKLVGLDLNAEIPAGEAMIMEMFLPEDGVTNVTPGFNLNGDSKPAYISAEECDIPDPVSIGSLSPDFENLAIIFAVNGESCDSVNVPYLQNFESAAEPDIPLCTLLENAGEGNNWEVFSGVNGEFNGKYLLYNSDSSNDANAWFYTKGINLTAGETYKISYEYGSSSEPENLKIMYGTSQNHEDMTNLLAEHIGFISGQNILTNTIEFSPSESGVYYFGFNAFSSANQGEIYVDNIFVELVNNNPDYCSIEYPGQLDGGLGDLQQLIFASDFKIEANTTMDINQFVVNIFGNISDANIYFYQDSGVGGIPGSLIKSFYSLDPSSQTYVGSNFGYLIYNNVFSLPESVQLDGGSSGKTYWVGLETTAGSQGVSNFWEKSNAFHGNLPFYSNDGGSTWNIDSNNMDLAFVIEGDCGLMELEEQNQNELTFYPNPVHNILNINSYTPITTVEIFNQTGQKVVTIENQKIEQINLEKLNPGVYLLKIGLKDRQIKTIKILKK